MRRLHPLQQRSLQAQNLNLVSQILRPWNPEYFPELQSLLQLYHQQWQHLDDERTMICQCHTINKRHLPRYISLVWTLETFPSHGQGQLLSVVCVWAKNIEDWKMEQIKQTSGSLYGQENSGWGSEFDIPKSATPHKLLSWNRLSSWCGILCIGFKKW